MYNVVLILLRQNCTAENPMQCCPRGSRHLQTTLHKKNVPFNVSGLWNLGPMQCCPKGFKQHCQEKIQDIQAMSSEQHLATLFTYVYVRSFTSKKIKSYAFFTITAETKAETAAGILPSNRSNF